MNLVLFGVVKHSSSDELFIGVSVWARLGEGMASAFVHSTLITMISTYYPNNASSYINAEIFGILLSELVGPLWGGLLFGELGYTGLFLLQSGTTLLFSLLLCYFRDHERAHPPLQIQDDDVLSYCEIFMKPVRGCIDC